MTFSSILLFAALLLVSWVSLTALLGVLRAHNKRRMLGGAYGRSCETLDCIGISALGADVCDPAQVENLLSVAYARYEVILVLDALRRSSQFEALIARYRMIRVDYTCSDGFPSDGVRGLYRSRKRGFRQLVVVDRAQDTPAGDLDVAAGLAVYDYLLPVGDGQLLLPDAIERLVVEVGERPTGSLSLVRTCVGEPAYLYNRDAVAALGGFKSRPARMFARRDSLCLWEPLFRRQGRRCPAARVLRGVAAVLFAAAFATTLWMGHWALVATLLTAAVVWLCAVYAAQLLDDGPGVSGCLYSGWRTEGYEKFHNS